MSGLRIARGLELDADYVGGGTFALLAKKGAGKTYTGRVMAEEFWKAKVPFVVLDPMGAWWGLRSSADGTGEGIPVAIFGGEHGDAPLERGAGAVLADLVVDEGLSMVLDLKLLGSRSAEREFARTFLERLYRRNRDLVHLFMDEADLFAPQKPDSGDQPLLGVTENIVRRGRNAGIGITLITQRPAVLNKDVLTQVDGLVAMRIIGLTDREAIDKWVAGHADPELAATVKPTLAGLANGECWWWVPELDVLKRVQVRASTTFDSSPTRRRGDKRREPKSFADVDMAAIEKTMAATIERAKASDPKALGKRIRELEKQLAERSAPEPGEQPEPETKVVWPFTDEEFDRAIARAEATVADSAAAREAASQAIQHLSDGLASASEILDVLRAWRERRDAQAESLDTLNKVGLGNLVSHGRPPPPRQAHVAPAPPARPSPASVASSNGGAGHGDVTPAKQRVLNALAMLEAIGVGMAGKTQLALFAQTSPKSSAYQNNLGALRSAGLIDYPAPARVSLTPDGRTLADAGQAPSTIEELHAYVRSLVGPSKARIVDALIAVYPDALARDELAERAAVSAASSGYQNNLGALRSLGLIDYPAQGYVVAQHVLFLTQEA
ncbi:MAG: hypothetical protein QOG35_1631 [Solirubrobacteraceae bacterium]|jgi:hypothetical protein|nr:hypothetical protein [Solirubrobacteraceae bacterium]